MSEAKNYALYRRSMTEALSEGACIPFLGVFLTQVVQIESYIMLQNRMRRSRFGSRRASKRRMSTRRKSSCVTNHKRSQAGMLSRSAETLILPPSPSPQPAATVTPVHASIDIAYSSPQTPKLCQSESYPCNSSCNSCCCVSCCNSLCNSACPSFPGSPTRAHTDKPCSCQPHTDKTVAVETSAEEVKTNTDGLGTSPAACTNLSSKGEVSTFEDSAYGSDGSTRTNSISHHSRESSADSYVTVALCSPDIISDGMGRLPATGKTTPDIKKPRASITPSFSRHNSQMSHHQPQDHP